MEPDLPGDLIVTYANDIAEHRLWLQQFNKQRLKKWEDLLKNNPEAAICEAETRKLLSEYNVSVEPYEDLSTGGPDFVCTKNGKTFYVETKCISIEAAIRISGLKPFPSSNEKDYGGVEAYDEFKVYDDAEDYALMTEKIRSEVTQKIQQCCKVKAPCIIVIATLHSQAGDCCFDDLAAEELLTGTSRITWGINTRNGQKIGDTYETIRLEDSIFIKPKKGSQNKIESTRNSVSAVLLCGFGLNSPKVIGCLNSNPNYPFDKSLLPNIRFAKLADKYQNGVLKVEWI